MPMPAKNGAEENGQQTVILQGADCEPGMSILLLRFHQAGMHPQTPIMEGKKEGKVADSPEAQCSRGRHQVFPEVGNREAGDIANPE